MDHPALIHAPVNLGSDQELPVLDWVNHIIHIVRDLKLNSSSSSSSSKSQSSSASPLQHSPIIHKPALPDDPPRRRPDTSKARETLQWEPTWSAQDGLKETAKFFFDLVHSGYSS